MKKILTIITLLTVTCTFAQEEVLSFTIDENSSFLRKKEGHSFSDTKTGNLSLILIEKRKAYAMLFDSDFNEIVSFTTEYVKTKYDNIIGYKVVENIYTIVIANYTMKKLAFLEIDFNQKKGKITELKVDFNKEKIVESVQYDNRLFMITSNKDNVFVLRELNDSFSFEVLKKFDIIVRNNDQKLLKIFFLSYSTSNVTKVDNRVPNSIEQTANQNKLYQSNNLVYLTIDNKKDGGFTTVHTIDLDALTLKSVAYNYPIGNVKKFNRYNSYILENKLIQLGSSNEEMKIEIKSFDGEPLKEIYFKKDQPITIKNSPIIQKGQTAIPFVNRREMEETSKFLRKISSGNIGITAYKNGETYAVTIGGYKEVMSSGGMSFGAGSTPVMTGGGQVTISTYNPTFYAYGTSTSTKSTYFNTTFDNNYNYIESEISDNIFEKIDNYSKSIKHDTAKDVFFHNGKLYYGYYDMRTKRYQLLKM